MNYNLLKSFIFIDPKIINKLSPEVIDGKVINFALKRAFFPEEGSALSRNYSYIIEMIMHNQEKNILRYINKESFSEENLKYILSVLSNQSIKELIEKDQTFIYYLSNASNLNILEITMLIDISVIEYDKIPNFIKLNNIHLVEKYYTNPVDFLEHLSEFIEYNQSNAGEIYQKAYNLIINDLENKHKYIPTFKNEFMQILNVDTVGKEKFLEYLILTGDSLKDYVELYKENNKYIFNYLLKNPSELNIPMLEHLDEVQTNRIVDIYLTLPECDLKMLRTLIYFTNEENYHKISKRLFEFFKSGIDVDIILSVKVFLEDYVVDIIRKNIEYIIYIDAYNIDFDSEKKKNISDILIEKNYVVQNNIPKFILENEIFITLQILKGDVNEEIICNYVDKYPIEYQKRIYDYLVSHDKKSSKIMSKILKVIVENNFDISYLPIDEPITFDCNKENQAKINDFLKQLRDNPQIRGEIILRVPVVDIEFLNSIKDILPGRIKIAPKQENIKGQDYYYKYDIPEIISKEKTVEYYAKTTNDQKDKNGDIKSLSPYEKYLAAYTITVLFHHYIQYEDGPFFPEYGHSRALYEIINAKNQQIVCVGYVNLLKELLKRMGIDKVESLEVLSSEFSSKEEDNFMNRNNHIVLVVHIKDEKYHIDNVFVADPTADAVYSPTKSVLGGKVSEWQSLDARYFNSKITIEDIQQKNRLEAWHAERIIQFARHLRENTDSSYEAKLSPIDEEKLISALVTIDHFVDKSMLAQSLETEAIGKNEYNEKAIKVGLYDNLVGLDEDVEKTRTIPYKDIAQSEYGKIVKARMENKALESFITDFKQIGIDLFVSETELYFSFNSNEFSNYYLEIISAIKRYAQENGFKYKYRDNSSFFSIESIDEDKSLEDNMPKITDIIKNVQEIIKTYLPGDVLDQLHEQR